MPRHLLPNAFRMACLLFLLACGETTKGMENTTNTNNINNQINNTNNTNNININNENNINNNTNNMNNSSPIQSDLCRGVDPSQAFTWDETQEIPIELQGDRITAGDGVSVAGTQATITKSGVYRISGQLSDGRIVVDAGATARVVLILDGARWTSAVAALEAVSAAQVQIHLPGGSENSLTDGSTRPAGAANATLHVASDLVFTGTGRLAVHGRYNDGIRSMKGLSFRGGAFQVDASDDGIVAEDCLAVEDGDFQVQTLSGDALKVEKSLDATLGFIHVHGGNFVLDSASDGMQAALTALLEGGTFDITCAGGAVGTLDENISAKGIKAGVDLTITGGTFAINSADDGLHSDRSIAITGGTFDIATLDDGIHAETSLSVAGASVAITKCYEGLEAVAITIDSGTLRVASSDDGINAAGDASPRTLTINDGYIFVNAVGDGLDINGSIRMTGGTLVVQGPVVNFNSPIDYDQTFALTGGTIVASGSSGMAQAPSTTGTTQYAVLWGFSSTVQAGTLIHLQASDGTPLLTLRTSKAVQSVLYASDGLGPGSYSVYTGGTYSGGTEKDGILSGGTYTPGSLFRNFTITSVVTRINIQSGPPSPPAGFSPPMF